MRLVVVFLVFVCAGCSAGSDTSVNQPQIRPPSTDVNSIFVGARYSIYRSFDKGVTWNAESTFPQGLANVEGFTEDVQHDLFLTSESSAILRSTDDGNTWIAVDSVLAAVGGDGLLTVGFAVLVGSYGKGVYRSTDQGETWKQTKGLDGFSVTSFLQYGPYLFATTEDGLYRSINEGLNWIKNNGNLPQYVSEALTSDGPNLYLSVPYHGLYKSIDTGKSWLMLSGIDPAYSLAINHGNLWAVTDSGLFVSPDSGLTWSRNKNFSRVATNNWVTQVASRGDFLFAGTYGDGVFRSTDRGVTWEHSGAGMTTVFSIWLR